jgi:hypothetical protein
MITAIWIISLLSGGLALGDQLRRPASEWVAADRDRNYWVTVTVIGSLFCLGVVAAIAYAISVMPRFGTGGGPDHGFRKQPAAAAPPPPPHATAPRPAPAASPPAPLWTPPPAAASTTPPQPSAPLPAAEPSRKLVIDFDDV